MFSELMNIHRKKNLKAILHNNTHEKSRKYKFRKVEGAQKLGQ